MSYWQGKVVFVTGAGSGIGKGLALEMARRGARLVVTDVNAEAAARTAADCGKDAAGLALDVRDAAAVKAAVDGAVQRLGRIDCIVNNAGIGVAGETDEIALTWWQHIVAINQMGVVHGVLAAYPHMLKQGSGQIVNTASLAGTGPAPLMAPYAMTKHAVVGLSTSLRIEAAPRGVKVSVLCPAAIETPLLDSSGQPGMPEPGWHPDMRRFLTALAGAPYPLEKFVREALAAIEANEAVIVLPARARMAWRIGRWFPALVEKVMAGPVKAERQDRKA